jgi:hypothetical protein
MSDMPTGCGPDASAGARPRRPVLGRWAQVVEVLRRLMDQVADGFAHPRRRCPGSRAGAWCWRSTCRRGLDAPCSADRLFCHVYGPAKSAS